MAVLYANNVATTLGADCPSGASSVWIGAANIGPFPDPTGGNHYYITLSNQEETLIEVMRVTSKGAEQLGVLRAQDGTVARSWSASTTKVQMRLTKAMLDDFKTDTRNTGLAAGTYSPASITVNASGAISAINNASAVSSVSGAAPIVSSGGSTPTISLNNSGVTSGTYASPSSMTVDATGRVTAITAGSGGGGSVNVQSFWSPGTSTWTKPANAKMVRLLMYGAGGGGGSGGSLPFGQSTGRSGGGGGGAGGRVEMWLPASVLGATETVTVGARGTGGAGVGDGGSGANGNAGTRGGDSIFGGTGKSFLPGTGGFLPRLVAKGGAGGAGGTTTTGIGGYAGGDFPGGFYGNNNGLEVSGNWGRGATSDATQAGNHAGFRGGGAGAGGGGAGGSSWLGGGLGGSPAAIFESQSTLGTLQGGSQNSAASGGESSYGWEGFFGGWGGTGGQGGSFPSAGGTGGDPGGGGGGGGYKSMGGTSGAGGSGAVGHVRVETYF